MDEIKNAINSYPFTDLDTIESIAEGFSKIAEKIPSPGTITWLGDITDKTIKEKCSWCQEGANILVCGEIYGEVDSKMGELSIWKNRDKIVGEKINYCPMCGRPVGGQHD